MKKAILTFVVLVILFAGVVPAQANEGEGPHWQGEGPNWHWYHSYQVEIVKKDPVTLNIKVEICNFWGCSYRWVAVTDATQIHGSGPTHELGFDDLQIGEWIYLEDEDGVATKIFVMQPDV